LNGAIGVVQSNGTARQAVTETTRKKAQNNRILIE